MLARTVAWRRVAVVGAVAITQVAGPLGMVAGVSAAVDGLDCVAIVPGVTARGIPTTFHYDDGDTSSRRRGPDTLGYQPRDIALPHRATTHIFYRTHGFEGRVYGRVTRKRSYWFTLSGQQLREVIEISRLDGKGRLLSTDYRTRLVRKRWSGIRQMSIGQGRKYLYVLDNKDRLLRYRIRGTDGNTSVRLNANLGGGFGTLGSFEYARTITILGVKHDVFIATDADRDELLEYTIPVNNPTAYRRTVLDQGGWADLRTTSRAASCDGVGGNDYDAIVGVDVYGAVHLWTDRNGADGNGNDIVDRGIIKARWRPLAYGN